MSAINGDKPRFHRKRKAGIARRARNREQLRSANQSKVALTGKKGASA
jgi:hypothetical protein